MEYEAKMFWSTKNQFLFPINFTKRFPQQLSSTHLRFCEANTVELLLSCRSSTSMTTKKEKKVDEEEEWISLRKQVKRKRERLEEEERRGKKPSIEKEKMKKERPSKVQMMEDFQFFFFFLPVFNETKTLTHKVRKGRKEERKVED